SIDTMITWMRETIQFMKDYHVKNSKWMDEFAAYPSGHLGMVDTHGTMQLYDGLLRAIDADGNITLNDIPDFQYADYFTEQVKPWSYLKFPYLKHIGKEKGWNRVGPLARINVCDKIGTPLAEIERAAFMDYTNGKPNNMTMHTHLARLIEMLHCAELMKSILHDEDIFGNELVRKGVERNEGIGIIEAPRGTLIHHYKVDDKGMITKCNLIVSTTHNNEPMNRAVQWVAEKEISNQKKITEAMLNQVEVAIRAYDPCLSCATHALGKMPLHISLLDKNGGLIDERYKE
ncbi:MAG: nickel-dependent hydrogenase large subunit, partial [Bacteroidota bacterium]